MLDVGAGNGSVLLEVDQAGIASELYAIEISVSGMDRISGLGLSTLKEVHQFDGYQIPYPDRFFDTAICIHVLEHVEHERLLLRELGRVAKTVFVEVPIEGGFRGQVDLRFGHINYYTPMTFLNLLNTSGLTTVRHGIFTSSIAYEQYCSGRVRGWMKNFVRRGALHAFPRIAPELMTYLLAARCVSNS